MLCSPDSLVLNVHRRTTGESSPLGPSASSKSWLVVSSETYTLLRSLSTTTSCTCSGSILAGLRSTVSTRKPPSRVARVGQKSGPSSVTFSDAGGSNSSAIAMWARIKPVASAIGFVRRRRAYESVETQD